MKMFSRKTRKRRKSDNEQTYLVDSVTLKIYLWAKIEHNLCVEPTGHLFGDLF